MSDAASDTLDPGKNADAVDHAKTSAGAYLAHLFTGLTNELDEVLPRIAGTARKRVVQMDEDAVHDYRVVLRRVRTLMKLSRPIYGRFHADVVRQAFAFAMKATGELRDEEVLEETLAALETKHPALTAFSKTRAAREARLRKAMVQNVRGGGLKSAQALLRALILLPVDPENDSSAAKLGKRSVTRAAREVERQKSAPTDDVSLLHDLRIAYKELRYATELFEPVLPPELLALAGPATKMQKRLGDVHDLDVAILTIARARVLPLVARSAALAELEALREKKVQKYIADAAETKTPAGTEAAASTTTGDKAT